EAIASGDDGLADFDLLRHRRAPAILCAFDPIELDGQDLRGEPIEARKKALQKLLRLTAIGLEYNEHLDNEDGARVFEQCLPARVRGRRVETQGLAQPERAITRLAEDEEPRCAGEPSRGAGRLASGVGPGDPSARPHEASAPTFRSDLARYSTVTRIG